MPKCDTGKGLVAADGLWATLFGVTSLAAFSDDETGTGVALAAVGALFIASAVKGSGAADECRSAYEDFNVASYRDQQEVLARRPTPARRTVEPKPRKKPKPVEPPPVQIDPTETMPDPPPETPPEPEYATPRPPSAKPPVKQQATAPEPAKPPVKAEPAKPKAQPRIPPPKKAAEEEWGDFWKEVP